MACSRPCSTFTSCTSGFTLRSSASVPTGPVGTTGLATRAEQPAVKASASTAGAERKRARSVSAIARNLKQCAQPENAERKRGSAQPENAERKRGSAQPENAERKRGSAQPE